MPNLFVIYILFIGLFYSRTAGMTFGIGIRNNARFMLGTVGFIGGMFDKNFSKESRITIIIMVVASTFIYEIGAYLIGCVIYGYSIEIISFIKILLIETLYNIIITIILYPLIQKFGYAIEEEYKGNKILTRYF